ncbi:hypothetical protein J2Z52_002560 [Enterococcus rivorum]|nr:hypothetical protein [Enterococcus rivorum]
MMSVSFEKKSAVASAGNLFPLTMILTFKLVSIVE